jgi:hypothetical protein
MSASRLGSVLLAGFVCVSPAMGVRADEPMTPAPVTRHFVHVPVDSLDRVRVLREAGFDLAGMNRGERTVGVVATDDELRRLRSMGFSYTLEASSDDPVTIQALSDYSDPNELLAFANQVVANYPNLAAKETIDPALWEGHELYVVKITKDVGLPNDRPTFVLDSQHHAREVMTAEIAKDMIDYLTSRYETDAQVRRWVDNINIWVVMSVNPDGAAYVFTGDNMWRKNRNPVCAVDNNRNYPHAWGSCNGSSGNCNDQTYRGFEPASEPETQGMLELADQARAFYALSYHTYGEYIMYPYGCNNPDEMAAMQDVAAALNGILEDDNGQVGQYTVGPIWSAIYIVDGGSIDSWYAQYGTYGFTIEANCCSFQPDYATWRNVTVQRQRTAWKFFLDRTLDGPQIRGKITDADTGAPVPARVSVDEVTFTHGEAPRRADSRGLYHWLARAGQTYHVRYSSPGYCEAVRTVSVGTGPATENVAIVRPTPPSWVNAVGNGDHRIDVSWAPATQATAYRVLRSLDPGGPYTEVALVDAPATTYSDLGVSGGVPYHYVVRALQPCESVNSAEAVGSTTGACTVGPAFAGLASVTNAEASTCSLSLSWPAASARCGGNVTYSVHRSDTAPVVPSDANRIASGLAGTAFVDHDGLTDSVAAHYVVRAWDASNGAQDGNVVTQSAFPTGPITVGTWTDDAGDTGIARFTGTSPWTVQPTGGKTGPAVYATGQYTNNLCSALTSPPIRVQSGSVLSFATKYDIETNWDAGIVEVAEGPAFTNWTRLATVNYPDSLGNTGNACGFPTSFTGTVFSKYNAAPAYLSPDRSGSLGAYAGKEIRIRFRIGSDGSGTGKGWWIDDVSVTNAETRAVCASGSAASPMEVGPAGAPLLAHRAETGTGIEVEFTPACGTVDNVAYWGTGPIVGAPSWTGAACGLGNTGRASFDPGDPGPGSFFYFVLVGQSRSAEGSYGASLEAGLPAERAEAAGVGTCDLPQDLSGVCP